MNKWASPDLIDSWDNTGFQIGDDEKEVERILISLDLDSKVLEKAINENYQMIITHHPLIFKPVKSITTSDPKGQLLYNIIKNEIVVYNAHTNLDQAIGGVNDELSKLLKLKDTKTLYPTSINETESYGYGKIGYIEEITLLDFMNFIKEKLDIDYLTVYGDSNRKINRVAVCGGSGSDFIYNAYKEKACIYITGDIKYHDAQLADELGLTLVDAGHYHTEKVILPVIKDYLINNINNLHIEVWNKPSPSYMVY